MVDKNKNKTQQLDPATKQVIACMDKSAKIRILK